MTEFRNSLLQDSSPTLQHISEDFDGTLLKQELHNKSSGVPSTVCIKPNLIIPKEESIQEFHASDHQGASVTARSTTSSILEDLLDIQDSTRAVHKADEQAYSSSHLVRRSSNASLLRSIINNDHSGAKKDFAKFFQKSRVSPAQSRRFIFQDGRAHDRRRSKELNIIESDKDKSDEGENSKGESSQGESNQAEIYIDESIKEEIYKDESNNEEGDNGGIEYSESGKDESAEVENYKEESIKDGSIKDEIYKDHSSDKGESDKDESIEGTNDVNIPFDITAESAVEVDSITDDACIPAPILMDSLEMASAHDSMDILDDWIDPEFWEDNVLVEKLNENIYEKEFYDNEHTIYVGKDKMLGPLCIAIKEESLTEDCDAIVRGQFLSAHIKLRQEDFADILAEGGAEDFKNSQNIKNISLLATLKAYTAFLEKNYPDIHGLIGQRNKQDEDIESSEKVDGKFLSLGSIQRLRKLADSGLSCFRSKQHQNNVDGICDAFRRLDLATVRRAHFIDVPVNEGEHEKANLLDVKRDGTSYSDERVHGAQANLTKQTEKIDPEKRSWVIQELVESEEKYLKSLRQLEEISRSIQQEILETKTLQTLRFEINVIFGNVTEIYQRHAALADCIKSRESEIEMCLGQILKENFENFSKPYYLYLSNRSKAIETHQKLMSKSNKYKKLIMNLEGLYGTATEKISISSLLIEPVQRIPRYTLLIDEILKVTAEDHEDRQHLHSAKDVANKIASVHEGQEEITARVINNLITSVKSCPPTLLKTNRRLISHIDADEIDVLNGKVLRYVTLILFNDILVVVKRVSQSASGKTILPSEQTDGGHDDLSAKYSHSNTTLPDMVATRNLSSHGNRADFKFKSSIPLTSVDISVPKRNIKNPGSLDDIIYIRTSDNAIDDQEYFSSGCLRQYVLGSNSHGGHAFVRLVNEHRASSSIFGEDQSFILKKHVGASDVFFCIRPQLGYNLCTTKNSMALCFENPNDANPSLVSNPTMLSEDGGLLTVQKHDNDTYRSTLSASLQVSNMIVSAQETVAKYQLTELLNSGRGSQRYRRVQFQPLMMKQLIFMDAALQSYKRRKMFGQDNRDLLEQLIKRFDSKLQRTIPTSLLWNQSRSTHAATAPPQYPQLQRRPSTIPDPTPPQGVELESAVTMVSNDQIRRAQPLVTQLTHVWEVVPIYDLTPPSPYQKRQSVKPSIPRQDKIGGAEDNINTDWNKIRVSNESNISLASQMSSMSTMSIRSRISTRNYMSINLKGTRSRHGVER